MNHLNRLSSFYAIGFCMLASVTLSACQSPSFVQTHTPEPKYTPNLVAGSIQTLSINPNRFACNSALPMQCLLATNEHQQTFQIPYDWIEGFNPVQNIGYRINVRPLIDQNTGQPTGKWQLVEIIN